MGNSFNLEELNAIASALPSRARKNHLAPPGYKWCGRCKRFLSNAEFYNVKSGHCRFCHLSGQKSRYRERNPRILSTVESMPGEIWKIHPRFSDYMVSTLGRVKRYRNAKEVDGERLVTQSINVENGRYQVTLSQAGKHRTKTVHTLVAESFLGPRPYPGAQVRHLDGDKLNNTISNLDYGTQDENMADRVRHTSELRDKAIKFDALVDRLGSDFIYSILEEDNGIGS